MTCHMLMPLAGFAMPTFIRHPAFQHIMSACMDRGHYASCMVVAEPDLAVVESKLQLHDLVNLTDFFLS